MSQAHCLVKTSGHSAEVIKTENKSLGYKKLPNGKYHWNYYNFYYVSQWLITDLKAKYIFKKAIPYIQLCVFVCACVCM